MKKTSLRGDYQDDNSSAGADDDAEDSSKYSQ